MGSSLSCGWIASHIKFAPTVRCRKNRCMPYDGGNILASQYLPHLCHSILRHDCSEHEQDRRSRIYCQRARPTSRSMLKMLESGFFSITYCSLTKTNFLLSNMGGKLFGKYMRESEYSSSMSIRISFIPFSLTTSANYRAIEPI